MILDADICRLIAGWSQQDRKRLVALLQRGTPADAIHDTTTNDQTSVAVTAMWRAVSETCIGVAP